VYLTSLYTRFAVDEAYRALVAEMLQIKVAAVATLWWCVAHDECAHP
jgi:hypothetical protein